METNIKTVEDAFSYTGRTISDFSFLPEKDRKPMEAHYKLVVIAEALNTEANNGKEWKPDWNNWNENKYYPFVRGSGVGFACDGCVYFCTYAGVGSRLCFLSRDLAVYAGRQFESIYKEYFDKE